MLPSNSESEAAAQAAVRMNMRAKSAGFTLIEVLITIVIVAILAAVAIPSYRNYAIRGKIPEATANLASKRVKMEQFFQDNRTYVGATAGNSDSTTSKYFDFSATSGGADSRTTSTYTLYAVGKSSMAGFTFAVDQTNAKSSTVTGIAGWSGNASCWVRTTGGQC